MNLSDMVTPLFKVDDVCGSLKAAWEKYSVRNQRSRVQKTAVRNFFRFLLARS
jgi:hypothetical protein